MDQPAWITALAGLLTALVSLVLLAQGQRDRRQLREDRQRAQAEKITFFYTPGETSAPTSAKYWPGRFLTILNHSEETILNLRVTFVANPQGGPSTTHGKLKQLQNEVSPNQSGDGTVPPQGSLKVNMTWQYSAEPGVGGDFAIVEFTDSAGRRWRRRTDTFELERMAPTGERIPIRHKFVEGIERRTERFGRPVLRLMEAWARSSFSRLPQRVPAAVRIVEWSRGHWALGRPGDPWLLPSGESKATLYNYGYFR